MKENSIEEDIKNLNEIIELSKKEIEAKDANTTAILNIIDLISLKKLLSEYRRLQEEFKQVDHECSRLEQKEVRLMEENEELKEYIAIAPNLEELTAVKYRNIQQGAYIKGREEEQQKAKQIIYENFISKQKVKDKIEAYKKMLLSCNRFSDIDRIKAINERILELEDLLEGRKENEI